MNMKKKKKSYIREILVQILYEQEFHQNTYNDSSNNQVIEIIKNKNSIPLDKEDTDYINRSIKNIRKYQKEIDILIQNSSQSWKMERMSLVDLNIMRVAVYEMRYDDIPFKVCINEAIEMAKIYGTELSPQFINGNLDNISKEKLSGS